MKKELNIIVVKFMIIVALTLAYIAIMFYFVAPAVTHIAFGQQFDQFNTPNQFNSPQDNFNNNQFQQGQYDQFQGNNQFQQPYGQGYNQQYGTPTYGPQYGYQPMQQQGGYGGFGIQEIITALIAGGGSAVYTKRRTGQLHDENQMMMSEILKGKQVDAEIARITYTMNQDKANAINDAPSIKLDNLQKDVEQFTDKTAKA